MPENLHSLLRRRSCSQRKAAGIELNETTIHRMGRWLDSWGLPLASKLDVRGLVPKKVNISDSRLKICTFSTFSITDEY